MVLLVESENWKRLIDRLEKGHVLRSPKVIRAMHSVPRGGFLPENMKPYSASDTPLPIGSGQTISAPHSFGLEAKLGDTWSP